MLRIRVMLIANNSGELGFTGHKIRASILKTINEKNPDLAALLHDPQEKWLLSPYSIKPLKPARIRREKVEYYPLKLRIKRGKSYDFEITLLPKEISTEVLEILTETSTLEIGDIEFTVSYLEAQKVNIEDETEAKTITIQFQTPTYFKSRERPENVLLPLPELFIASAAKIWNTYIEQTYDIKELAEKAKRKTKITAHKLKTVRPIQISKKRVIIGFVGKVTYEILDKELAKTFGKLAKLAEITNIGGGRTAGFGVIRILKTKP